MQQNTKKIGLMILGVIGILHALNNGVARQPPMGWNTWNVFRQNIDEKLIREMADSLVSLGLADAGYNYLVIDNGWCIWPNANTFDPKKFPSGIKALADYVHSKGLKFGLYTHWDSEGKEDRDAKQWAEWGVDFVKHDAWTKYSTQTALWTNMRDAILKTGRPMVYSAHFQDRNKVLGDCNVFNMWRFGNDLVAHFNRDKLPKDSAWAVTTMDIIEDMGRVVNHTRPGCWADADMFMIGEGAQTLDEWKTQFAMWSILPSPLKIPSDLRKVSQDVLNIYLNKEIIAVNQDTLGSKTWKVRDNGLLEVWARVLADGSTAVVLLNASPNVASISVTTEELKLSQENFTARDLWNHQDLGQFSKSISQTVPIHGTAFLKITATGNTALKLRAGHKITRPQIEFKNRNIVVKYPHQENKGLPFFTDGKVVPAK